MTTDKIAPPPFIEIHGPPQDRGRQYGKAAATKIALGASIYEKHLDSKGVKWGRVVDTSRILIDRLKELKPVQHSEVVAIAEGAGVDPAEILLINGRSEVLNAGAVALSDADKDALDDDCTGAVALPERTRDGNLIHGQNWDWMPECAETAVVLAVRRDDGPDLMTFVEAGGLARAGLNENGVAITGNNLTSTSESWDTPGVALSIVRRLVLEADGYALALNAISRTPRSISNNMIVSFAHDDGDAINLETTAGEIFWIVPEDGLIVHSNHFTSPAARAKMVDRGMMENMDTLYRDRRMKRRLDEDGSKITVDTFKSAFADKFGHPRGVLRTPNDSTGTNQISATVATIIMEPAKKKMWVRQTPYENEEYTVYSL